MWGPTAIRSARRGASAVAALLLALSAGAATLDRPLVDALATAPEDHELPVIVVLAPPRTVAVSAAAVELGREGRRGLVRDLKRRAQESRDTLDAALAGQDISNSTTLWAINAVAMRARPSVVRRLATLPEVSAIRLDAALRIPEETVGSVSSPEWNLSAVRAPALWASGHTGAGAVVASLDSGFDIRHPELAGRWRGGAADWFDPHGEHATPFDRDGHGTQTIGLIVGGSNGGPATGVAPGATFIAAKIFNDSGTTTLSAIHRGFQWVLDPDGDPGTDDAADVVNGSWGFDAFTDRCDPEFGPDIAVLRAAGIVVVFPAGNSGPSAYTSLSPANNPGALAVGAVDELDRVAGFSGRGPSACAGIYPHVVAPGVNVRTTDLTFGGTFPDSYAYVTGTSFAAPQVAGALALLRDAFPAATPLQLEDALERGAADLGEPRPNNDAGWGRIDVLGAYTVLAGLLGPPSCTDADVDGYFAEPGCGTLSDCNDGNPAVHPGACGLEGDGIDQDCDGRDDDATCHAPRVRRVLRRVAEAHGAAVGPAKVTP